MKTQLVLIMLALGWLLVVGNAQAAKKEKAAPAEAAEDSATPNATPSTAPSEGETVNVENIKEKYWARGDESEMGVVQNRLYSKEKKFEIGLFGGFLTSDPFLSVRSLGGSVGYHFTEYFSAHLLAWKSYAGQSSAYTAFQENIKQDNTGVAAVPPTNNPLSFFGAEASGSILYGKLSLVGKSIIYYDMHVLGGLGSTSTETGKYFTPYLGVGQQVYLNKVLAFRLDYRIMHYRELQVHKQSAADQVASPLLGKPIGERDNWTHAITLGVSILTNWGAQK